MSKVPLGRQRGSDPLPFEHLFLPLVVEARADLQRRVDARCLTLLRAEAHMSWERYLLQRLCNTGAKAAHCQFQAFKTARSVFSRAQIEEQRLPDRLYQDFVGTSPTERLRKLFEEFPKLAAYCDLLISDWVATVSEFLVRFNADYNHLNAHFAGGSFACPVTSLQAGFSEPHHSGRCVVRIDFESGSTLFYKPRPIVSEARFFGLLEQFNVQGIPYRFKIPRCWERDGYGWMENVASAPCDTLAGIQAFYWRAGALLALIYLARGVDMHRENLIAAGEFPVLIDLETLWHPQQQTDGMSSSIADSVLSTGLLPVINPQTGAIYEWNALGHRRGLSFPAKGWVSINEDNMRLEQAKRTFHHSDHLPVFATVQQLAVNFLDDILAGFHWVGEWVFGSRREREKFQRWIKIITQCPRRKILRPSQWYQAVLEQLTAPPLLRTKEVVASDLTQSVRDSHPITQLEWHSLQHLEIPWLKQEAGQKDGHVTSLPAREMDEFMAQKTLIIEAFAFHAKGG